MKNTKSASITISKNSNNKINITIRDDSSRIQFFDGEMDLESYTELITGLSMVHIDAEYRDLGDVGKHKIVEKRSVAVENYYNRKDYEKYLVENCQEKGWILNSSLSSQTSITHYQDGKVVLNYFVYKYVSTEEYDAYMEYFKR